MNKLTLQHRKNISKFTKLALKSPSVKEKMSNSNSIHWKGDNVGYFGLHNWIRNKFGNANKCEGKECSNKSKNYHWANVSKKYKRDISDWIQLCVSCHRKYDFTEEIRKKLSKSHLGNKNTLGKHWKWKKGHIY